MLSKTMHYKKLYNFCSVPARSMKPKFNHEKTLDKPKLRDTLQNKYLILIKYQFVEIYEDSATVSNQVKLKRHNN